MTSREQYSLMIMATKDDYEGSEAYNQLSDEEKAWWQRCRKEVLKDRAEGKCVSYCPPFDMDDWWE